MDWIKTDPQHTGLSIYLLIMAAHFRREQGYVVKLVDEADISNFEVEETALMAAQLRAHPVIFIHSLKEHNDIVNPDNFRLMLENTPFLKHVENLRSFRKVKVCFDQNFTRAAIVWICFAKRFSDCDHTW